MYPQEHLVGGLGFPAGSDGKESACNARDPGSVPGSGRSHGERNGYPLSTFAWRIPWTEDPGMLQSMRSRRVGHYWATNNLDSKHGKIVCDYIQIKLSYLLDFVTPLLLFLQFIGTVSPSESDFLKMTFQKVTILCLGRSAYFSYEPSWDPQNGDELAEGRHCSISFCPIEKDLKTYGGWDTAYEEKIAKFRK